MLARRVTCSANRVTNGWYPAFCQPLSRLVHRFGATISRAPPGAAADVQSARWQYG